MLPVLGNLRLLLCNNLIQVYLSLILFDPLLGCRLCDNLDFLMHLFLLLNQVAVFRDRAKFDFEIVVNHLLLRVLVQHVGQFVVILAFQHLYLLFYFIYLFI